MRVFRQLLENCVSASSMLLFLSLPFHARGQCINAAAPGVPPAGPGAASLSLAIPDHVYGDAPFQIKAITNSAGAITYAVPGGEPATSAGNTITLTHCGTVHVVVTVAASGALATNSIVVSFNVAQKQPSMTFLVADHTLGDSPFPVSAASDSPGAITYAVKSGPASIPANTNIVSLTAVGTVILEATVAASGDYGATSKDVSFGVESSKHTSGPSPALPCSNCYASLGAGTVLNSAGFGDYTDNANVLENTHLGASTPQYTVGVAYRLPIYGPFAKIKRLECSRDSYTKTYPEASAAYCFPFKAFVSLKFSPDASQTFNGYTFGLSHSIAYNYLDLMIGVSYTAFNEVSPGFQQAALNVVSMQQAASNPYYAQYNLQTLKADGPTAYDGFPVQLLKADGTTGPLIYNGNPLVNHYHSGLFLGVSIPVSLKSVLGVH